MNGIGSDEASSLIEFSLLAPMVIFLFMGLVDFSIAISQAMAVTQAANLVAEFGTIYPNGANGPNATNNSAMTTAAANAAGALSGLSVTPSYFYACTAGAVHVLPSSVCPTYANPLLYVQVTASATVPLLVGYPGLPGSIPLQSVAVMRVP